MAGARGTHRNSKAPDDGTPLAQDVSYERSLLRDVPALRKKGLDALKARLDVVTDPEHHDTAEILQILRYFDSATLAAADRVQRAEGFDPTLGLAGAAAERFRLAGPQDQGAGLGVGPEPGAAA